ncbi:MAG TPA: pitrilysin family protein [Hyphomicrobiaceae bacterium]|jgi:zinc protease|nr:pitrilysin family protein [Hyphomicrobiaceae bacterium]
MRTADRAADEAHDKSRGRCLPFLLFLLTLMLATSSFATAQASTGRRVSEFKLANGLTLVVVPDNRAPVVTHMVYYRVGSADEPPGVSGIAHFLEHLMFKSTEKLANGEMSAIVSRLGGQQNAFTTPDYTAYFQRVSKDRLKWMMEMEADRMMNLRLDPKEVDTERQVIIEERRVRIENVPSSILGEQMAAALYQNHPYRIPVIGWMHEMAKLSREDALAFYQRFYAPNNAIVVVTGDVVAEEVKKLAEATYGLLPPNPRIGPRVRPREPEHRAPRRVELKDPRAGNASVRRYYLAPAMTKAAPGEAEALYLLMKIAAGGSTSRLYQTLVVQEKLASSTGGWYSGMSLDSGSIGVSAVAVEGVSLDRVEHAIDRVLRNLREKGVTAAELDRAKKQFLAEFVYETDSQVQLARRYGAGLSLGLTLDEIERWPAAIARVTPEDVQKVASKYLDIRRSVTGTLIPGQPGPDNIAAPAGKTGQEVR